MKIKDFWAKNENRLEIVKNRLANNKASGIVSFEGMFIKMHNFFLHKKSEIRE